MTCVTLVTLGKPTDTNQQRVAWQVRTMRQTVRRPSEPRGASGQRAVGEVGFTLRETATVVPRIGWSKVRRTQATVDNWTGRVEHAATHVHRLFTQVWTRRCPDVLSGR